MIFVLDWQSTACKNVEEFEIIKEYAKSFANNS